MEKSFLWSFETQFLKKREENFDLPAQHFSRSNFRVGWNTIVVSSIAPRVISQAEK